MKKQNGITLISLVITIIVLVILASVGIYLALGDNGILNKAEYAKNETTKQTATERMNLKITNMQIEKYAKEQRMPTLQEFADGLCMDNEVEYVELQSKKVATLDKIEVGEADSIFTKLKEYPYEFEINSSLQLASVDGIKVATNNNTQTTAGVNYSLQEIKTNDTWMGKPIYTKTIYIDSLPNTTETNYNHNIQNVETIWVDSSYSYIINETATGNSYGTLPYIHDTTIDNQISVAVNESIILISNRKSNRSSWSAYITLRYTKTTDTAS